MKVRMEENLQLIISPESYVEQVALSKWADTVKGECGLLIESYAQHRLHTDPPSALVCTCAASRVLHEKTCPLANTAGG